MIATATTVSRAERPSPAKRVPRRLHLSRKLTTLLVIIIVAVQIYPLLWLILTSLRPGQTFGSENLFALPSSLTIDNYIRAFETADLGRFIINSFLITAVSSALIVFLGMSAAYAIQVLRFRFSKLVLAVFLMGIIVPVQVALVPLFINYSRVGLLNTYLSVIIPLVGFALPISIYLFVSFFQYIPNEIYEAASLDGAGPYRIFFGVTMPLSSNTVITVVFVNSIFIWNDFIFANTFLFTDELKTIPLGLQNFIGAMGSVDWTATFAAACVTITPLLLVFLVLNRAIIYGLESGASKG
jgi:raffinose/stachyose/melibiose transport system permease protein